MRGHVVVNGVHAGQRGGDGGVNDHRGASDRSAGVAGCVCYLGAESVPAVSQIRSWREAAGQHVGAGGAARDAKGGNFYSAAAAVHVKVQNFAIIERGADVDGGRGVAGQVVCSRIVKAEIAGGGQHRCWGGDQRGDSVEHGNVFNGFVTQGSAGAHHAGGEAVGAFAADVGGVGPSGGAKACTGIAQEGAAVVDGDFFVGGQRGVDAACEGQCRIVGGAAVKHRAGLRGHVVVNGVHAGQRAGDGGVNDHR